MTNDRVKNDETKTLAIEEPIESKVFVSSFALRHSSLIRHSNFVFETFEKLQLCRGMGILPMRFERSDLRLRAADAAKAWAGRPCHVRRLLASGFFKGLNSDF